MGKHAELPASGAERWINCPASVREEKKEPPKGSSKYARQGTAAHFILEHSLLEKVDAEHFIGRKVATIIDEQGETDGAEGAVWADDKEWRKCKAKDNFEVYTVDREMVDAVQLALDAVRDDPFDDGMAVQTEVYSSLDEVDERIGGTADVHRQCIDGWIDLFDYKHGAGVVVEAKGNLQLKIYALGLVMTRYPMCHGVRANIIQPRAPHVDGPVRSESWTKKELEAFKEELRSTVAKIDLDDPPYKAGKWCRWCSAAYRCPELRREAQQAAVVDFEDYDVRLPDTPSDNDHLSRVLKWAPIVDAFIKACEGAALRELQHGRSVAGFKLVRKKTNRAFSVDEAEVVKTMVIDGGVKKADCYGEPKLKSPAQMERLGKAAKAAVAKITFKPQGGITLAPENDPRPAVQPSPEDDFDDLMEDDELPEIGSS